MQNQEFQTRTRVGARVLVAIAALVLAWLTDASDFDPPAPASASPTPPAESSAG